MLRPVGKKERNLRVGCPVRFKNQNRTGVGLWCVEIGCGGWYVFISNCLTCPIPDRWMWFWGWAEILFDVYWCMVYRFMRQQYTMHECTCKKMISTVPQVAMFHDVINFSPSIYIPYFVGYEPVVEGEWVLWVVMDNVAVFEGNDKIMGIGEVGR